MLLRLISRLHKTGLVQGTSLARWLRIVSRTRLRLYQSSLISAAGLPPHRVVRHGQPTDEQRIRLELRPWNPPEVTEEWSRKFMEAADANAWRFVLYEYERRN